MRDAVNTVKFRFSGPRCKSLSFGRESFVFSPIRKRVSKGARRLESLRAGDPLIQGQRGVLGNEQEDEGGPRASIREASRSIETSFVLPTPWHVRTEITKLREGRARRARALSAECIASVKPKSRRASFTSLVACV